MEEKKKRSYYNLEHQMKYQKAHTKRYYLKLVDKSDSDIIEKLGYGNCPWVN